MSVVEIEPVRIEIVIWDQTEIAPMRTGGASIEIHPGRGRHAPGRVSNLTDTTGIELDTDRIDRRPLVDSTTISTHVRIARISGPNRGGLRRWRDSVLYTESHAGLSRAGTQIRRPKCELRRE